MRPHEAMQSAELWQRPSSSSLQVKRREGLTMATPLERQARRQVYAAVHLRRNLGQDLVLRAESSLHSAE